MAWRRVSTGAGAMVCGGPSQGPECHGDTVHYGARHWLGPGNTNVARRLGSTRYSTLPVYPPPHPTRYTRPAAPAVPQSQPLVPMCCTAVLRLAKEILGVNNAQVYGDGPIPPHRTLFGAPHWPLQQAPVGGLLINLSYISVISQFYSVLMDTRSSWIPVVHGYP